MYELRRSLPLMFIAALAGVVGCRRSGAEVPVTIDWTEWTGPRPDAPVLVQFNHRWPSSQGRGRLVRQADRPKARPDEQVVTAFLDVNRDGRLSPFEEPRVDCVPGTTWICRFRHLEVALNRYRAVALTSGAFAAAAGVDRLAQKSGTEVHFQAFDPRTGRTDQTARLCADGKTPTCLPPMGAEPRSPAELQKATALCGAAQGAGASFRLAARGREMPVSAPLPAPLPFEATARRGGGGTVVLEGKLAGERTELVAWLRVIRGDKTEVLWNTEDDRAALALDVARKTFTVTVPPAPAACRQQAQCLLGIQARQRASEQPASGVVISSSEALALALVKEIP